MDLLDKLIGVVKAKLGMAIVPHVDHLALYPATVQAAAADGSTVDVQPLDARLEAHQGVPLRQLAGCTIVVKTGAVVLLGFEGGDPSAIYALPTFYSGAGVTSVAWIADLVTLGATGGAQFVALANLVASTLGRLQTALDGWTPVAQDGGAALKAALTTANIVGVHATWPDSVAAAQVKAK